MAEWPHEVGAKKNTHTTQKGISLIQGTYLPLFIPLQILPFLPVDLLCQWLLAPSLQYHLHHILVLCNHGEGAYDKSQDHSLVVSLRGLVPVCVRVCARVCVCKHVCVHVRVCMSLCVHVCMLFLFVHMCLFIHMHMCIFVYTCVHNCTQ